MNKEKKNRVRCVNCISYATDSNGKSYCMLEPKYRIDRHTRKPAWCSKDKVVDALADAPLEQIVMNKDEVQFIGENIVVPQEESDENS